MSLVQIPRARAESFVPRPPTAPARDKSRPPAHCAAAPARPSPSARPPSFCVARAILVSRREGLTRLSVGRTPRRVTVAVLRAWRPLAPATAGPTRLKARGRSCSRPGHAAAPLPRHTFFLLARLRPPRPRRAAGTSGLGVGRPRLRHTRSTRSPLSIAGIRPATRTTSGRPRRPGALYHPCRDRPARAALLLAQAPSFAGCGDTCQQ